MNVSADNLIRTFAGVASVLAAAYLGYKLLEWVARRYSDRYPGLGALVERARRPFRALVGLIAAQIVTNLLVSSNDGWLGAFDHALQIGVIGSIGWLAVAAVSAIEEQVIKNDAKSERDAVDRRRFDTQITMLRRLVVASIISLTVIAVLLTFPSVRSIGTTLLASAGLISIIAGLAAQTSLTNVFAGIQLALSDSVRVGDVIVVNNQIGTETTDVMGTVTQLTLTHVEMRLWDGRVLILPSAYFIVQPFENLTRNRSLLIETVTIDVDLSTPVDDVRQKVTAILKGSDFWDGQRDFVLVSSVRGTTLLLQIGMSAASMEDLIALQALVREQISEYLVEELPESLVRSRTESMSQVTTETPGPEAAKRADDEKHHNANADSGKSAHDSDQR